MNAVTALLAISLGASADLQPFIDGLMEDQLRTANIAGATLAIVEGGEIVLARGYGVADSALSRPVDPDETLFRPGSVSKLITYTAVMQLVERGMLRLDAAANDYLEAFQIPPTYPEPVRIRHLISHTAGFENINIGVFAPGPDHLLPLVEALQQNVPRRVRPVDELAVYSNYGVSLAGHIVSRVSGLSFFDYVEQNIFAPLGMNHSTFREPVPEALAANVSQGHVWHQGAFMPVGIEWIRNVAPAGSMSTTATDMARFMIAHLQLGRYGNVRILEESTARTMHSQLFANDPRLPGMAHGFKENRLQDLRVLNHRGDSQWFHSDLQLFPDHGIGFFVSYNSPLSGAQRESLSSAIIARFLPRPELAIVKQGEDFAGRAGRFTGDYLNMNRAYSTFEKFEEFFGAARRTISLTADNMLFLDAGYRSAKFVETGSNLFRQVDGTEIMAFREDDQGRVSHFFLSSWPATSMERASPWTSPLMIKRTLVGCMLVLFAYVIGLQRLGSTGTSVSQHLDWILWLAPGTAVIQWTFLIGFGYLFKAQAGSIYMTGLPAGMQALLLLPLVAAAMTVVLAGGNMIAWSRGSWTMPMRLLHTGMALSALAMVWFSWHYNLLGLNY